MTCSFWGKADKESERGNITDDGTLDLAGSGINATDAMAVLNIGSFDTYVRKVSLDMTSYNILISASER